MLSFVSDFLRRGALCGSVVALSWCFCASAMAFGSTLDEMYRGVLREENDGALPSFVLNRGPTPYPEQKPAVPDQAGQDAFMGPDVVQPTLDSPMPWVEVVKDVAGGRPGPFAVEAVKTRAENNDPQATELLAWMFANGIGVSRDLAQSFGLYVKADKLGVSGAKDNAKAIYKSMPPGQRRVVLNPFG